MEKSSTTSSQNTARPDSPEGKVVHAIASNSRRDGQKTPILLRTHIHGHGPVTPPRSDEDAARASENDLNLDLQELGLEDFTIKPEHLLKLEKIGSGGFKEWVRILTALTVSVFLLGNYEAAKWPSRNSAAISVKVSLD